MLTQGKFLPCSYLTLKVGNEMKKTARAHNIGFRRGLHLALRCIVRDLNKDLPFDDIKKYYEHWLKEIETELDVIGDTGD